MFKKIVKRDGKIVDFNLDKITDAIAKAGAATEEFKHDRAAQLSEKVVKLAEETVKERTPTVEQIQDLVEKVLMDSSFKRTAKAYITYRQDRNKTRNAKSNLMGIYKTIAIADASEDSDVKRSNANVDGNSAMGKMLQFGAEGSKVFAKTVLLDPRFAAAHDNGDGNFRRSPSYYIKYSQLNPSPRRLRHSFRNESQNNISLDAQKASFLIHLPPESYHYNQKKLVSCAHQQSRIHFVKKDLLNVLPLPQQFP